MMCFSQALAILHKDHSISDQWFPAASTVCPSASACAQFEKTREMSITHPWGNKLHFLGGFFSTFVDPYVLNMVFCFLWLACRNPGCPIRKLSQVFFPTCVILFNNTWLVRWASFLFTLCEHLEKRINLVSSRRSQNCSGSKSRC